MNSYKILPINSLKSVIVTSFSPLSILVHADQEIQFDSLNEPELNSIRALIPEWVKAMNIIGRQGEILAYNYLRTIFNIVSWIAKDSGDKEGFDIAADEFCFEVKSTRYNANTFYISLHELLTAHNKGSRYRLIFIKNVSNNPKGYIINDIFNTFSLSWDSLTYAIPANGIDISANVFKVSLDNDFLSTMNEIDLKSFDKDKIM